MKKDTRKGVFFAIKVSALPAPYDAERKGIQAQPNRHFKYGFEASDSKNAS